MSEVVAYVPDLMDRSKVAAAGGDRVQFVPTPEALAGAVVDASPDVVVIDLARAGALDAVRDLRVLEPGRRLIGFGSHVDRALLEAARAAGCDEVLARSAFFGRLPELLA